MAKIKVLWCDKNSDYVESFIQATRHELSNIEFVLKDEPVDAIQEILNNKDYKLIISGQLFRHLSGTDFFEIVLNNKIEIPFLLLTAQVDYGQYDRYELWSSFNYLDKLLSNYNEVSKKVLELSSHNVTSTFELNIKLKNFRISLGLSPEKMAALLGTSLNEVLASESDYKKIKSSYVLLIANEFNIDIKTLIHSSTEFLTDYIARNHKTIHTHTGRG